MKDNCFNGEKKNSILKGLKSGPPEEDQPRDTK